MTNETAITALTGGQRILRSQYELFQPLAGYTGAEASLEAWEALDDAARPHLIKLWRYSGAEPDQVQRALWDAELRTMYRIGSSPGAEEALVTMRDAGVDRDTRSFVMVLQTEGFADLATALRRRTSAELAVHGSSGRRQIWKTLRRLLKGLQLLHEQNVVHRDVRAENILLDAEQGLESLRLGGFEWSVRLGTAASAAAPVTWATPPERQSGTGAVKLEDDWFGFGIVAARCLLDIENFAGNEAEDRLKRTHRAIERTSSQKLTGLERNLLRRLIAYRPTDRLTAASEIDALIRRITTDLAYRPAAREEAPFILAFDERSQPLIDTAREAGFVPSPDDATRAYNQHDPEHVANLVKWLRSDLDGGEIHSSAGRNGVRSVLVGRSVSIALGQFVVRDRSTRTASPTWNAAYCTRPMPLLISDHTATARSKLPGGRLTVVPRTRLMQSLGRLQTAASWDQIIPEVDRADGLRADLARFHDFLRCTNQIDLLMRDAELFAYEVIERGSQDGVETLSIQEVSRSRAPAGFAMTRGLVEFLEQEVETGKPRAELVLLTSIARESLDSGQVDETAYWRVVEIDKGRGRVQIERQEGAAADPAPDCGLLRAHGMAGQLRLIRRRKTAIDKLNGHAYLLRSLSAPGQVYMDTGESSIPVPLPEAAVDEPKHVAIEDILRVRPIYTLQGPPGTGKTTLVAWLVRQILADDPVAQILVTAQAHGAVDVLREKVASEAFEGVPDRNKPLAVRLRRPESLDGESGPVRLEADSVEGVSLRILQHAVDSIPNVANASKIQNEWRQAASEMIDALRSYSAIETVPDFCELVKRGSHLIYCTTSAGELEALAKMTLSFDWSIVEEAGKAHGFDLALPLQAGHRWLLIGDQHQLPPYRYDDYAAAIGNLEGVVQALLALPDRGAGLVDFEWATSWREKTADEKSEFAEFVGSWLKTFERIFTECANATGEERLTSAEASGAAAGRITGQHRMHPTIGQLISDTYYDSALVSKTVGPSGQVRADVVHPFSKPEGIAGRSIVWLDVPAASAGGPEEVGPAQGGPRYTNPAEANALAVFLKQLKWEPTEEALDLAVLSPYSQQVQLLRKSLKELVPTGLTLKAARRRETLEGAAVAHTVDSFQGNQAKVIAVSLVRNNLAGPGEGLGFLQDPARMNVLLSRAESLLVLVGSFDFFKQQVSLADAADPYDELGHLRRAMDLLEGWFASGKAVRIPTRFDGSF